MSNWKIKDKVQQIIVPEGGGYTWTIVNIEDGLATLYNGLFGTCHHIIQPYMIVPIEILNNNFYNVNIIVNDKSKS